MSYLSGFVITLVTTIILISAVEIIAPDNSMKKYIKFVLGLILIVVMINPIIGFFTKGEDEIIQTIKKYENMFETQGESEDTQAVSKESEKAFQENLNKNCENMLKEKFPDKTFESEVKCSLDTEKMTYNIDEVKIGVKDGKVKLVDKIKIKKEDTTEVLNSKNNIKDKDEIIQYVEEVFGISQDKIEIYKIEGEVMILG